MIFARTNIFSKVWILNPYATFYQNPLKYPIVGVPFQWLQVLFIYYSVSNSIILPTIWHSMKMKTYLSLFNTFYSFLNLCPDITVNVLHLTEYSIKRFWRDAAYAKSSTSRNAMQICIKVVIFKNTQIQILANLFKN